MVSFNRGSTAVLVIGCSYRDFITMCTLLQQTENAQNCFLSNSDLPQGLPGVCMDTFLLYDITVQLEVRVQTYLYWRQIQSGSTSFSHSLLPAK